MIGLIAVAGTRLDVHASPNTVSTAVSAVPTVITVFFLVIPTHVAVLVIMVLDIDVLDVSEFAGGCAKVHGVSVMAVVTSLAEAIFGSI